MKLKFTKQLYGDNMTPIQKGLQGQIQLCGPLIFQ